MIHRKCEYCSSVFSPTKQQIKNGGGKYCSVTCSNKSRSGGDSSKKTKLKCKNCKEYFFEYKSRIQSGKGKYCSKKCYTESMYSRQDLTCEYCGGVFSVNPSAIKRGSGKYCSKKCYGKSKLRGKNKECKECGKEYYAPRWTKDSNFCSQSCTATFYGRIKDPLYPNTHKLRKFVKNRRDNKKLADPYIKSIIWGTTGLLFEEIPQELIELKRLNIKRKRIIRTNK